MEISNMLLENLQGKALEEIAQAVGIDAKKTKTLASIWLPLLLSQLEKNASTHSGAESINEALNKHLWKSRIDIADGVKILAHLFSNTDEVVQQVSAQSSKSKEETLWVLSALSSVIMETLWDQKKAAGWFETTELMKLLSGTGKDVDILWMVMEEPHDSKVHKEDTGISSGMSFLKKLLTKKK